MDNAGLIAAAIAAAVVYRLAANGLATNGWRRELIVPARRRDMQVAFAFVLSVQAVVLLSIAYSSVTTNRDLVLHLDKTETKLTHMEQIIQNLERHSSEMMSTLSEYLGNVKSMTHKITTPDGTHGSELAVAMEEDDEKVTTEDEVQPQRDETMDQEFQDRSEDDVTNKPWRLFIVPEDHVLVIDCVGDKLSLLLRSPPYNLDQHVTNNGQLPYTCGQPHQAGTPSTYDRGAYRALFWSLPGEERVVPVPWPEPDMWERLTTALLENTWDVNPPIIEEKTAPESFTISADEVLFYRPWELGRMTRVLIAASEDVVRMEYHQAGPAVSALAPYSVLPLSFTDSQQAQNQVVRHVNFF